VAEKSKRKQSNSLTVGNLAVAEFCAQRCLGGPDRHNSTVGSLAGIEHPAILIQGAFQEIFRPVSPSEVYSDEQPFFVPQSAEQESLLPIDILFGRYFWKTRTIKIFHKNIAHFATSKFKSPELDLQLIVRLHEYAHALIHLGLFWKDEPRLIRDYPSGQESDWKPFLRERSAAFRSLPGDVHEFVAQVVCWMTIGKVEPFSYRDRLQELFIAVMKSQPAEYVLSEEMLGKSHYADPTFLLSWARKRARSKLLHNHSRREFAMELLRVTFP